MYSVPTLGGTPTVLASFNGTNGQNPYGGLVLSGSTLYGVTNNDTINGDGTVFSLVPGDTPTVLANFNRTNGGGINPWGGLTLSGSTLYGTTQNGGIYGGGTVFSMPTTGGTPTILASFLTTDTNEYFPDTQLIFSGSTLYGTTLFGGMNNRGTVFSVPATGGTPTILASFNSLNGQHPFGNLVLDGSTLYGTASGISLGDGSETGGTVFSVPITGGDPTVLATFNGTNGQYPVGGLTLSDNTLYGTTDGGGTYGDGTVFSLTPAVSAAPEPSSWVSLGLILTFGLGCNITARKRARTQGKVQR